MENTCGFVTKLSIAFLTIVLIPRPGLRACSESERAALLEIKSFFQSANDIEYADEVLSSWVVDDDDRGGGGLVSDCCDWEGIKCNPTTGRVMALSLNDSIYTRSTTLMNFSLFHPFEELQSLDLSLNGLGGLVRENKGGNYVSSGSLKQLKILNLGVNYFNDSVLPYLNTLTSLTTLILIRNEIEADSVTKQGLSNLKNLQVLDLSYNPLMTRGSLTRLGLPNLTNLKNLNLDYCGITSLRGLANLTNLKTLNLVRCGITSLRELTNLKNLEELDLTGNANITSGSLTGLGTLCQLKNLIELDLSYNALDDIVYKGLNNLIHLKVLKMFLNHLSGNPLSWIVNLTSLEFLDVSNNNFQGSFSFCSLANHSKLQVLVMSNNRLISLLKSKDNCVPTFQLKVLLMSYTNINVIPSFLLHQNHLKFISLSHNKLVGNFPTWLLHNNTKLEVVRLRNNSLSGTLEMPPKAAEHDYWLLHLDISINNFTGELPKNLGIILHQLKYVDISKNSFQGNLPNSIGELKELEVLDLSKNNFSGELPHSVVTGCFSLQLLDISNNNFSGEIFSKDLNWTQVSFLNFDNNYFGGNLLDGLLSCAFLRVLHVSNNMLSGQIPRWVGNFSSQLEFFSLSKNRFEGDIPPQLFSLPRILVLDISENSLSGPTLSSSFNLSSSMLHLYMQKNALNGLIPSSLFRSSTLMTLDLRDNKFSGGIPDLQISEHSALRVLLLRGNNIQGDIPHELCRLQNLGMMDLSSNKLNGSIPSCVGNMSFWRESDESDELYGDYLEDLEKFAFGSMGSYYNARILNYVEKYEDFHKGIDQHVQVEFSTKNRYELYNGSNLNYMTGLDLSCNELTGEIPSELGQLQKLHALNLSHNYLSGPVPKTFSNMKMIESLDLSHNKLSGRIPLQLDELHSLSNFNVSFNNLSGPIPDKGQFDGTFDESSYVGNEDLCGSFIRRKCESNMLIPPESSDDDDEEEDEGAIYLVELYWSFGASYVTVLLCWVAVFWINSNWRRQWFYFIDKCIDTCYYWIYKYVIYKRR